MEEMLFRGKRLDNGEWVIGYYVQKQDPLLVGVTYHFILVQEKDNCDCLMSTVSWYKVVSETVGQYSGLNLKDTKVFDGDIIDVFPSNRKMYVLFNEETLAWEIADVGTKPCEVNHLVNCMSLGELGVEACFENDIRSKVIGNIYDNPELIMREGDDDELRYKF